MYVQFRDMDGKPITQNSFLNANCRWQYFFGGRTSVSALEESCGKAILADDVTSVASRIGENADITCLSPWLYEN